MHFLLLQNTRPRFVYSLIVSLLHWLKRNCLKPTSSTYLVVLTGTVHGNIGSRKKNTIYANVFSFYETEITWALKSLLTKLHHKNEIARWPVRYDELRIVSAKQCHDRWSKHDLLEAGGNVIHSSWWLRNTGKFSASLAFPRGIHRSPMD